MKAAFYFPVLLSSLFSVAGLAWVFWYKLGSPLVLCPISSGTILHENVYGDQVKKPTVENEVETNSDNTHDKNNPPPSTCILVSEYKQQCSGFLQRSAQTPVTAELPGNIKSTFYITEQQEK